MRLRVAVPGEVNPLEGGSRSEGESEEGGESGAAGAKLCDLPMDRLKAS